MADIVAAACASGLQSLPRVPPQRTRATPPTRVWIKLSELSEFQKVDRERGIEGPQRAPAEIRVPVGTCCYGTGAHVTLKERSDLKAHETESTHSSYLISTRDSGKTRY
jgi:hypothetical protein